MRYTVEHGDKIWACKLHININQQSRTRLQILMFICLAKCYQSAGNLYILKPLYLTWRGVEPQFSFQLYAPFWQLMNDLFFIIKACSFTWSKAFHSWPFWYQFIWSTQRWQMKLAPTRKDRNDNQLLGSMVIRQQNTFRLRMTVH